MGEIRGPVHRVDDPSMGAGLIVAAAFLGQNGVVRKSPAQDSDDRRFGFAVGLGYQVQEAGLAFETDVVEAGPMNGSGRARRAQRGLFDEVHG